MRKSELRDKRGLSGEAQSKKSKALWKVGKGGWGRGKKEILIMGKDANIQSGTNVYLLICLQEGCIGLFLDWTMETADLHRDTRNYCLIINLILGFSSNASAPPLTPN